ncbi:MAG: M23 family metallopeptidase [Mycetocola sp.]
MHSPRRHYRNLFHFWTRVLIGSVAVTLVISTTGLTGHAHSGEAHGAHLAFGVNTGVPANSRAFIAPLDTQPPLPRTRTYDRTWNTAADQRFVWPVTSPALVRAFERPRTEFGPGHRGIDISASTNEVRAAGSGVISFSGCVVGQHAVSIDHGNGLVSTVLSVAPRQAQGDTVSAGSVIGHAVGVPHTTSRSCADQDDSVTKLFDPPTELIDPPTGHKNPSPHQGTRPALIHVSFRLNGAYVDPMGYLPPLPRARLLPWE